RPPAGAPPSRPAGPQSGPPPQAPPGPDSPNPSEQFASAEGYDQEKPEAEPKPWYRNPVTLTGWALLVMILIALIVYGIIELISDRQGTGNPSTTTPSTTTSTTVAPATTPRVQPPPQQPTHPPTHRFPHLPPLPSVITIPGVPTTITLPPHLP
ncbi:hypothetical protein, partial [Mycobacterium marinum]|uniref:hypothetical protein n=1 Tax=Mycobacterium marinum TaxID=1781 RepID=UPI003FED8400